MQPFEQLISLAVVDHIALGYFQHNLEVIGWKGGGKRAHILFKAFRMQMPGRDVDPKLGPRREHRLQDRGIADNQVKKMQRQRDNQLLRFSEINKGIRWNFSHHRMLPAHQDFQPGHFERLRIHDGLIDHVKLVAFDGR